MSELTKKIWHVNGAPWEHPGSNGATINIGSEDPHKAIGFIEVPDMDGRTKDEALELAEYICKIHNEKLIRSLSILTKN